MPEIAELSKHIMIEETKQGLNIEIVDQNGRSMFPEARRSPTSDPPRGAAAGRPVQGDAEPDVDCRPYRGERRPAKPGYGPGIFPPTAPMRCASILEEEGVPVSHFFMVAGRADTQPLFPDNPFVAANRRVTITLMREAPPIPPGFKP